MGWRWPTIIYELIIKAGLRKALALSGTYMLWLREAYFLCNVDFDFIKPLGFFLFCTCILCVFLAAGLKMISSYMELLQDVKKII